jgi:hypothetical protein
MVERECELSQESSVGVVDKKCFPSSDAEWLLPDRKHRGLDQGENTDIRAAFPRFTEEARKAH